VPFGDRTNGITTYGAGRYLLDTIKDADLGREEERLGLDFAYNPSAPTTPAGSVPSRLRPSGSPSPVAAGERML
jgi:uncharacterized protein (DUF1684 family)